MPEVFGTTRRFMLLDDRLATVLNARIGGKAAASTQFRQLVDLLGSIPSEIAVRPNTTVLTRAVGMAREMDSPEIERIVNLPALRTRHPILLTFMAYIRLDNLSGHLSPEEQADIIRQPGLRLRNRQIIAHFANAEVEPASAALAVARLSDEDWEILIPQLPIRARGLLRHRRNLPAGAIELLDLLGAQDRVLPTPPSAKTKASAKMVEELPSTPAPADNIAAIGKLLRRIEAFKETRGANDQGAPRLPLGDTAFDEAPAVISSFNFACDEDLRINWADEEVEPLVHGMRLALAAPGVLATLEQATANKMSLFQPIEDVALEIDAHPAISGEWRMDADPIFERKRGRFIGYQGRIRRPELDVDIVAAEPEAAAEDSEADRMRQMLHELRTPVNAIQGFAEIIQQQLFGTAPNEYRAMAAGIAVDAAKLLASFDEIDRLTKLESGAMDIEEGDGDLREVLLVTIQRLEGVLRRSDAGFDLKVKGSPFVTTMAREDLLAVVWRILASLGGNADAGERLKLKLSSNEKRIKLRARMPRKIDLLADKFSVQPQTGQTIVSSGMFGTGFSLRLARAEIEAAGGKMVVDGHQLAITLPLLTAPGADPSNESWDERKDGTQG